MLRKRGEHSTGNVQGLYAEETSPEDGSYDASVEEILHLVTQKGYSRLSHELDDFKGTTGNVLSDAMDAARGGRFPGGFPVEHYPAGAWYSYNDVTCTYGCQKTEYLCVRPQQTHCKPLTSPTSLPSLTSLTLHVSHIFHISRRFTSRSRFLPQVLAAHILSRGPGRWPG